MCGGLKGRPRGLSCLERAETCWGAGRSCTPTPASAPPQDSQSVCSLSPRRRILEEASSSRTPGSGSTSATLHPVSREQLLSRDPSSSGFLPRMFTPPEVGLTLFTNTHLQPRQVPPGFPSLLGSKVSALGTHSKNKRTASRLKSGPRPPNQRLVHVSPVPPLPQVPRLQTAGPSDMTQSEAFHSPEPPRLPTAHRFSKFSLERHHSCGWRIGEPRAQEGSLPQPLQ